MKLIYTDISVDSAFLIAYCKNKKRGQLIVRWPLNTGKCVNQYSLTVDDCIIMRNYTVTGF